MLVYRVFSGLDLAQFIAFDGLMGSEILCRVLRRFYTAE